MKQLWKRRVVRSVLCLLLCVVFCGGAFAFPSAASGEKLFRSERLLDGGVYAFAMKTTPSGGAEGEYAVTGKTVSGGKKGLEFLLLPDSSKMTDDFLWTVRKDETGCVFYAMGEEKFLNLTEDGATLNKKAQSLQIREKDGQITVYVPGENGKNLYLRFSGSDTPRWTTGTTDSANLLTIYEYCRPDLSGYDDTGKTPLYTVACFSDLHADYGLQSMSTPIRSTVTNAAQLIARMGGADVVLVGGDITSANDRNASWSKSIIQRAQQAVYDTLAPVSHSGKVLFVAGNHDYQAGVQANHVMDSGDYTRFMTGPCGPYADALYKQIDGFNSLLGYRYSFDAMEYLAINSPYNSDIYASSELYTEQVDWAEEQLKKIGKDKTVIMLCHYPVGGAGTRQPSEGTVAAKMKALLEQYPNVIYCYGHVHGNDSWYVWYYTSELVRCASAVPVGPNTVKTSSYITVHMGSMGYYNTQFQPGWLGAEEPQIAQVMMIYFYDDHITFRMLNTGEKSGDPDVYNPASYTVARDNTAQFGRPPLAPGSLLDADLSDYEAQRAAQSTVGIPTEYVGEGGSPAGVVLIVIGAAVAAVAAAFCVYWFVLRKKTKAN